MKRDLDLIRHILIVIENSDSDKLTVDSFTTDEFNEKMVSFHISLLLDCGYIEAAKFTVIGQKYQQYIVKRMTSSGYDYLDAIRSDNIWFKTKEALKSIGNSASLDIIKAIAGKIALSILEL